jgi:hypothetical protein
MYRLRYQRDAFAPQLTVDPYRNHSKLWKGELGFSPERWQFWKERVQQLRDLPEVSHQSKRVADETIAEVNRIEETAEENPPFDPRFGEKVWEAHQARKNRLPRQ